VTISQLIAIPSSLDPSFLEPSHRTSKRFIMLTSDGRAYHVTWGPSLSSSSTPHSPAPSFSTSTPSKPTNKPNPFTPAYENVLFDLGDEKNSLLDGEEEKRENWEWNGECFHPSPSSGEEGEEFERLQELELDKGRGASTATLNLKMDLIAIGCEE